MNTSKISRLLAAGCWVMVIGMLTATAAERGAKLSSGRPDEFVAGRKCQQAGLFAHRPTWFGKYDERIPAVALPQPAAIRPVPTQHDIAFDSPDAKWINGLPLGNGHIKN